MVLRTSGSTPGPNAKDTKKESTRTITASDLTREPEFIEKLLLYLERKNIFQSVSISVQLRTTANNNGLLVSDLAFPALRRLLLKYPLLFSFPVGDEPTIRWEPLEEIRFNDVFAVNDEVSECFTDKDADTKILNDVSIEKYHREKKPLWKLVYYEKTGWLTFHSAHCFTDGGSVIAYLKEFVEGLNNETGFMNGSESNEVLFSFPDDMPLLTKGISDKFFDRIKFKPDIRTRISRVALRYAVTLFPWIVPTFIETHLHSNCFVDRLPRPFSTRSFFESEYVINETSPLNNVTPVFVNVPWDDLHSILESCRRHQVKLQTYIILVYLHTIHELYPNLYARKFLKIGVAVNLRNVFKELSNHQTYLGNKGNFDDGFYTYMLKYFVEPSTMFSWEAVKKYHDFLHKTINNTDWVNAYYVASESITAEAYMDPRFEFKRDDCFLTATNLGHIDFIEHQSPNRFQVENILFAPCSGSTLGTHHVTACSTSKNGLGIGFADGDQNIRDWNSFKATFKSNLVRFGSEQE